MPICSRNGSASNLCTTILLVIYGQLVSISTLLRVSIPASLWKALDYHQNMPAIQPPAKVLVTGSNGYIGTWIVRTLLDRGFFVRAAVRAESKTTYLRQLFKDEVDQVKLDFAIVPDIITPGAFDEAVKDIDAIIHAASPTHLEADDPDGTISTNLNERRTDLLTTYRFRANHPCQRRDP